MSPPDYSSARLRPRRAGFRFIRCLHPTKGPIQHRSFAASDTRFLLLPHAVDGTKIFSQASEQEGLHREALEKKLKRLDEAIKEIMEQTERAAKHGGEWRLPEKLQQRQQLRETIQKQLKQLEEKERDHLQPKDEDAREIGRAHV